MPTVSRSTVILVLLAAVGVVPTAYFLSRGSSSDLLTLGPLGWPGLLAFAAVVVAFAVVPVLSFGLRKVIEAVDRLLGRSPDLGSAVVGVIAGGYLLAAALGQHRPVYPYIHDESSYLIQAHQLASFHLWMPAHPVGDFFDSFQLFVRPVYASAYFPGTAIAHVPGIWLGVPHWVWSVVIAGVVCGLMCRVVVELLDGTSAVLAVVLLLADDMFREESTMTVGQPPLLMFGLSAVVAWLIWRKSGRWYWLIGVGLALSLAAATRPVDALCFGLPVGIAILIRKPSAVAWVVLSMLPLLVLQLTINKGVTGGFTRSPFRVYADADYPGTAYGFHPYDPAARPVSTLAQKQDLYRLNYALLVKAHSWSNVGAQMFGIRQPASGRALLTTLQSTFYGFPLLVPLIPMCLAAMTRPRAVVVIGGPLFLVLYVPYAFFFPGYVSAAAPAVIVAILVGVKAIGPRPIRAAAALWVIGLGLSNWPIFFPDRDDAMFDTPVLHKIESDLSKLPGPSIVLFTYDPKRNINEEPVYNADVAWPDDAPIIRAHDLGPRNAELLRYYDARSPVRSVYRYDERTGAITELGRVGK